MKQLIIFFTTVILLTAAAAEQIPGGWTESGELAYSYTYARSWLGYQMRKDGWRCKTGFTAGRNGEQEHSVWVKGNRKMQMMIWRIDSGRTGYSKGEIKASRSGKK